MTHRSAAWLAWTCWAFAILCVLASMYLTIADGNAQAPGAQPNPALIGPLIIAIEIAIVTVGALISSRHSANPIGWILTVFGVALGLGDFAGSYAIHALFVQPGSLPGGAQMAWIASAVQGPSLIGVFPLLFLLFPDGHLLSPRWRFILWTSVVLILSLNTWTLRPGPLDAFPTVQNPFGIQGAGGLLETVGNISFTVMVPMMLISALSVVLRFRRARAEERQQIKWLASAAGFMALAFLVAPVFWFNPALNNTPLWTILFFLALAGIPLSIGIAILKYRLYDIDIIIRRTLIYGLLTVILALLFNLSSIVGQQLFSGVTGQSSELATIVSTLGIAALFSPLRHRIQEFIDRRFYRKKYDAQQVLAAFGATVRDEVDLSRLTDELLAVVDNTMQPTTASLWLRSSPLQLPPQQGKGGGELAEVRP